MIWNIDLLKKWTIKYNCIFKDDILVKKPVDKEINAAS